MIQTSILSPAFLFKYEGIRPRNAGVLFDVVYLRTYSRWLEEKKRRETWKETVKRVVEYSISLYQGSASYAQLVAEAELMFDKIFHLEVLPSGRTLWVGGTESARKFGESQYNCFARETEFLTKEGYKTFETYKDGDKVDILSRFGGWKSATIRKFEPAKLLKLTLSRGIKTKKEVFVTPNHRWVVRKDADRYENTIKTTDELKVGDLIPVARRKIEGKPCSIGIQHGLVYGDGTINRERNHCLIDLRDDSQQFDKYFSTGLKEHTGVRGGVVTGRSTRIINLPNFWKQLPSLESNSEYLLGFLMGWFGADGSSNKDMSNLCSANRDALQWARSAFAVLGIYTSDIQIMREKSPFDGSNKPLYRINIFKQYLTKEFFIKDTHQAAFKPAVQQFNNWMVSSVEETNREEEVWCVQEPEQECFTLASGVLTKNCSFACIDSLEAFGDLFQLLLCGCGAGFRVLPEDIAKLPDFNTSIEIEHLPYEFLGVDKLDETYLDYDQRDTRRWFIEVGDSREAWVEALREFLSLATMTGCSPKIIMNYNNIRPEGSRIKSFGGKAPGHTGLQEMFSNVAKVIQNSNGRLTAVDAMDICNYIGKNVIVGGTRRSSQIALGCPEDELFTTAKKDLWTTKLNLQRTMSNNSVVFSSPPSLEQVKEIFKGIKNNGEPGFFNLEAARKRRPDVHGLNPCAEILLNSKGFCNLSTVNLMAFVEDGKFNLEMACEAFRLATRIGLRITNVTVSLPEWDKVQKSDRLLGVSLTGLMDMFDAIGVEFDSLKGRNILCNLKEAANDEADRYAFEMRVPRPLLVTCIKPEGTLSQLPTVSSGLHRAYAPYYIRRIRVSAMDAVAQALDKLGVPNEPDKGKAERLVFSFPIKTQATILSVEEPASRQFERYLTTMEEYTDHNSSCTITVGEDEWEIMENMVHDRFGDTIAAAFLPKHTDAYPQMPYEAITKEQYDEMKATFPCLDGLAELVNALEQEETEDELEVDCASGYCPVR